MADLEQKVVELTDKVVKMETKIVQPLEKVLKAMSRKVLSLECQIEDMKKINIPYESAKELGMSKNEEEKHTETKSDAYNETLSDSFIDDNKVISSTPKDKKEKGLKSNNKEEIIKTVKDNGKKVTNEKEVLKCKECSYECKKEITLKKHKPRIWANSTQKPRVKKYFWRSF